MTSEERREARYQRRKARRAEKRKVIIESIGTAEEVFCFHDLFKYGEDCCKGVMWKQSTQTFHRHLFSRTAVNRKNTLAGYKPKRLHAFTIKERGKRRDIEAPHIDDRQIQKCLTKKVLIPLYAPRMIYDNGASLKGKGLIFSQNQLDKSFRRHLRKYGIAGWIIITDCKGFFPNADRDVIKSNHVEIEDPILRGMLDQITDIGCGRKGMPLGVEPSQIEMISLPSPLDNFMSCQMGLSGFGHYMDDYHILVPPDRDPYEVFHIFKMVAAELGIEIGDDKTRIIPFGKPFKFCKMKRIWDGDRIIKRACRDSVKRARRKMRKFHRTEMDYEDIYSSITGCLAGFRRTDDHGTLLALRRYFFSLFGFSCEDVNNFRERSKDGIHMPQAV